MRIKIINKSKNSSPQYSSEHSARIETLANLDQDIINSPFKKVLVKRGLCLERQEGFKAQRRPNGRLDIRKGITVLKDPGTIEGEYRFELSFGHNGGH